MRQRIELNRELRGLHGQLLGDERTRDRIGAVMGERFQPPTVDQEIALRMMGQELHEAWDAEDADAIARLLPGVL